MEHESTARLGLPLLATGQAGKELTHNEALALIDLVLGAGVEVMGTDTPPAGPAPGQAWIVGSAPTGAWAGRAGAVAGWTGGGWRFVTPFEGLSAWIVTEKLHARYAGGGWVAGGRAIAAPAGGGVIDAEARAAVTAVLAALRTHGLIAAA